MKKLLVVLFTGLCIVITPIIFAETRIEIQTALDLIRFTNVANDLFNESAKIARGEVSKKVGTFPNLTDEPMTVEEIKESVKRSMENIDGYYTMITTFLSDPIKRQTVVNGLTKLGITIDSIINDLQIMKNKSNVVTNSIKQTTTKEGLFLIGNDIDKDIPQLNLIRNK